MSALLTRFRIEGLHGRRNVSLPIEQNRLILVGENGTGKSTVANLLYYLLTRQWRRIKDYRFGALEVTISGSTIGLSHDEVETLAARHSATFSMRLSHHYPARLTREIYDHLADNVLISHEAPESAILERMSEDLSIPLVLARRITDDLLASQEKLPKHLAKTVELLASLNLGQFLYLPTYRRIEQDLK